MAQTWNGKLPTVMTGNGDNASSLIPVLDLNQLLPATEATQTTTPTETPAPGEN